MENVTPAAAREVHLALSRYNALTRRPRTADAWAAIECRLWNAMQPVSGDRRVFMRDRMRDAAARREYARATGRLA